MRLDPIWLAFAETGDPLYYLLYREANRQQREGRANARRL